MAAAEDDFVLVEPQGLSDEAVKPALSLPADFLLTPGPKVTRTKVDFNKTPIADSPATAALYAGCWAVVLDNVFSPAECATLLAAAEATNNGAWERAMVNVGGGQQKMYTDIRNCGRIIWDDREIVKRIWDRCRVHVPEMERLECWPKVTGYGPAKRQEVWEATRLNERMRFLKYQSGEFFKPHCDGCYETPDREERSYFTLHLYLNDETSDPKDPLRGGATTFHSDNLKNEYNVYPKIGRVLLFQHAYLIHSGADVQSGTKYTLRSDVMYRKSEEVSQKVLAEPKKKGKSYFWSNTLN